MKNRIQNVNTFKITYNVEEKLAIPFNPLLH